MRSNTSLLGRVFMGIALQARILEQREQRINLKIYSLPSREKNNLW